MISPDSISSMHLQEIYHSSEENGLKETELLK